MSIAVAPATTCSDTASGAGHTMGHWLCDTDNRSREPFLTRRDVKFSRMSCVCSAPATIGVHAVWSALWARLRTP